MSTLHYGGDIIDNRYQIVTLLGEGGTGKTYSAIDLNSKQTVAIKAVFLSQINDWKILDLFEREAKVLATLNHSFIPKYLDYFYLDTEGDRKFYLVQELVAGESLYDLVKNGWHTNEEEVKNIAIDLLEILNYIHQLSPPVIHRDIKPQNIIRREDGKIYLVDFGAVQDLYRNTLSLSGTIVGTFGYMPPEQFRGRTFFASDLYSLGATLIFLLTHRSPAELPHQRLKIDFRNKVSLSEDFAHWLDKMTAPSFEERYHSAEEALQVLQKKRNLIRLTEIKPALVLHRPPKGSAIFLDWKNDEFFVSIPPAGWRGETFNMLLFSMIWNLFFWGTITIMVLVLLFLNTGFYLSFILFLFLSGIGVLSLGLFLWKIRGIVELKINRDFFTITRKIFNLRYDKSGNTKDIMNISVIENTNPQGKTFSHCLLEYQNKNFSWYEHQISNYFWYKFGDNLTTVEQDWLVKEIRDFIVQVRIEQ